MYPLGNMPERWVIHGPGPALCAKWNVYMSNKTSFFDSLTFRRIFFFFLSYALFCLHLLQQQVFPSHIFLRVIIMNEVGRTANTPYLKQTLVVTVLSSHCAEESPTNRTPSYLSLRPCRLGVSGSIKEEHSR